MMEDVLSRMSPHRADTGESTLEGRVMDLMDRRLSLEVSDADLDLFETGQVDSLAFVILLESLEQEFDLKIAVEDFEVDDFRTVRSIAAFVRRELTAQSGEDA
jgi:acyl carrier protein